MPRATVETRPNRKVTEFFQRKSKPASPSVIDVSSGSEYQSVITVSSDELSSMRKPRTNALKASSLSKSPVSASHGTGAAPKTKSYRPRTPKHPSPTQPVPSSRSKRSPTPQAGQKRKNDVVVISSEESDDSTPMIPVIHCSPSRTPQPSFSQVMAAGPLMEQRQNFRTPSPKIAGKLLTPTQILTSDLQCEVVLDTSSKHRPSPLKRPRYSLKDEKLSAMDCDADDERDEKNSAPWEKASTKPLNSENGFYNLPTPTEVSPVTPSTPVNVVLDFEGCIDAVIQEQPSTMSIDIRDEVVPSSQEDEIETPIDEDMNGHQGESMVVDDVAHIPMPDASPSVNISPNKARTNVIIANIKARAEARAAAEAEKQRKLSECGLTSDDSGLSSLSESSESGDDNDLDLNIEDALPDKPSTRAGRQKFKLAVLNDNLTTSQKSRRATTKTKTVPCPLDGLIKDSQREENRRARIKGTRKYHDTPPSDINLDSDPFSLDTPKKAAYCVDSEDRRSPSPGMTMKKKARDELLGIKSSKAVGVILDNDKRRKEEDAKVERPIFSFWGNCTMPVDDVVPSFPGQADCSPFFRAFRDVMDRRDYNLCSMMLDSGALTKHPCNKDFTVWLFSTAMSTSQFALSSSAYHAFLGIFGQMNINSGCCLASKVLVAPLLKLGVNDEVASLLDCEIEPATQITQEMKVLLVHRFVTMLETLANSQSVNPSGIPVLVGILTLLALDASSSYIQQDIMYAVEALLGSQSVTASVELDTCRTLKRIATSHFMTHAMQVFVVSKLSGGSPNSNRIRRWLGWTLLGGNLNVEEAQWGDTPSLSVFLDLFDTEAPGQIKLVTRRETDFEELGSHVEILAVALTDTGIYMDKEGNGACLEKICQFLEILMGRIVDTRAAHLDRTRTKEAINRLHKRLIYQCDAAIKMKRNGKTGRLDQYFTLQRPE